MSRENLESSLNAVETALEHLNNALVRGGFEAGAANYRKMADIIVGQRIWATENGVSEFDPRFRRVAELAERINDQLSPYCFVMERLGALGPMTDEAAPKSPLEANIIGVLRQASSPMSTTAIRGAVGAATKAVKLALQALVQDGVIRQTGSSSRPRFQFFKSEG